MFYIVKMQTGLGSSSIYMQKAPELLGFLCKQGGAPRVADFVHGSDGLGNTFPPEPKMRKIEKNAADFLIEKVKELPHEVTVLALAPLTNIAEVSRF